MIIISSCLAGIPCRYDGKANTKQECLDLIEKGLAITACPEVMGGLSTPRKPCEIVGGDGWDVLAGRAKVLNTAGEDVTAAFVAGAQKFLDYSQLNDANVVYLKSKSPSCGNGCIYDGTFSKTLKEGDGIVAALLRMHGIDIISL